MNGRGRKIEMRSYIQTQIHNQGPEQCHVNYPFPTQHHTPFLTCIRPCSAVLPRQKPRLAQHATKSRLGLLTSKCPVRHDLVILHHSSMPCNSLGDPNLLGSAGGSEKDPRCNDVRLSLGQPNKCHEISTIVQDISTGKSNVNKPIPNTASIRISHADT